jgi:hypothetical protein
MPINAVQFTILSIIATGYKVVDTFIYSGVSLLHRVFGIAQLLIKRYSLKPKKDLLIDYFFYYPIIEL